MNNEVFKIVGSVLLQDEEFKNGIRSILTEAESTTQKVAQKFKSAGDKISSIGKTMTVGLTTSIGGLVGMGVKYNVEMETLETNLSVLLGSTEAASKRLEELRTMGAKTPFETTDLVKATQKMLAFGLDADKTNGYLQTLGDIAMGDANKLDSLTLAFSQIGASGRASMEDINQMIDQGFNPLTYVIKNTGESMSEVRDRVSAGGVSFEEIASAMNDATSEGGAFYQSMDKASQTTAGRISTLKDNFGTMVGTLTNSLMPSIEKVVDKVAEWIDKFNSLDQGTKDMIVQIMLVVAVLGPILIVVGKVVSAIGTLITTFSAISKAIKGCTTAMKILSTVFKVATGPVGIVITIVGALVAAFMYFWNTSEGFRQFWYDLWDSIQQIFGTVVEWINTAIQSVIGFFQDLWKGIQDVFNAIVLVIQIAIGVIASIFNTAFQIITLPFRFIWENCKETIITVFNTIVDFISSSLNTIWSVISTVLNTIWTFISTIMNTIWSVISTVWNAIYTTISTVVNTIWTVISTVFTTVWNTVTTIFNGIWNTISSVWNTISTTVSNVVNGISSTISNVFNGIKNTVTKIWNGIKTAIETPINKAKEIVSGVIDSIKGFFKFEFKWPKLKLPHFGIKPKGWEIGDLLKGSIPTLGIDWYAKGAIFDEPTIVPTMSGAKGVGEAGPEAVAPISELMKYTRLAVDGSNAGLESKLDMLISLLTRYLPMLVNMQVILDTGELVGAISPEMDKRLGDINKRKERGN